MHMHMHTCNMHMPWQVSLWIYRIALGIPLFGALHVIGIFIILGIGCDDLFIMADAWKQSAWLAPPAIRSGTDSRLHWAYMRAAKAILFTTLTDVGAFLSSLICPVPNLQVRHAPWSVARVLAPRRCSMPRAPWARHVLHASRLVEVASPPVFISPRGPLLVHSLSRRRLLSSHPSSLSSTTSSCSRSGRALSSSITTWMPGSVSGVALGASTSSSAVTSTAMAHRPPSLPVPHPRAPIATPPRRPQPSPPRSLPPPPPRPHPRHPPPPPPPLPAPLPAPLPLLGQPRLPPNPPP